MQKARIAVSLSKALGDGGDATILISEIKNGDNYLMRDEIRNADINSTLQTVVASDTTRMIQQIFDFHLEPREKEILEMRYYHVNENNKPLTLREIGEKLNISNERVRQVQEQALKKLRSLEGNALADLLD
jgi:RNA polymerase sigma factor (sigma-70 family)